MSLEKRDLYRFPWSKNDNPIAWLEITDICDLHCEGCYRQTLSGHKPLDEIKEEILFFKRWRNPDNVSIAGGEPLLHPDLPEIVSFIAGQGIKPIVLTNAANLTPAILRELKHVGLAGFTIHIDSHQGRPGWKGKSEAEHNELRAYYAEMIAAERGLLTIFNSTVYPSTFPEIPEIVRWARDHADTVHGVVFITYRILDTGAKTGLDGQGHEVDATRLSYTSDCFDEPFVDSPDVYRILREHFPAYAPSGYLGGTARHDSFKWLAGATIGTEHRMYGSIGPKTMELAQAGHHFLRGTYLAYLSGMKATRLLFLLAPWDRSIRHALAARLRDVARRPWRFFSPIRLQTLGIIQAPDIQPSGDADMCDSCPDMTVWNGTLINSCRMDEYRLYGGPLSVVERANVAVEQDAARER